MSTLEVIFRYKFVILFYGLLMLLLFIFRKKFDKEGKFVFLYRTKYGLKLMDFLAKKFSRFYYFFGLFGIWVSYPGIAVIFVAIVYTLIKSIIEPSAVSVAPVIPGLPIAGTGMTFPLITGWICLFVIIVIHESSHGIIARLNQIKVKSSGIAFFGPLLAAFVEPDEKQLEKQKAKKQLAVYAAGPFSNIVTSIIFILLFLFAITPISTSLSQISAITIKPQEGLPAWNSGIEDKINLVAIDNYKVSDSELFFNYTDSLKPNQTVRLYTLEGKEYTLITTVHPENETKGYMGVNFVSVITKPKYPSFFGWIGYHIFNWGSNFFYWLWFIGINIGLINLLPFYITDGAKILQITLVSKIKKKETALKIWKAINSLCLLMLFLLLFLPLFRKILGF